MQIGLVKSSFYFTYIFLITTGTICFIEALRNPNPRIRHIMNLETCISIVAGYFYGLFLDKLDNYENIEKENEEIPYQKINDMRYTDWAISTPIMLLVLCLVLGMENKINVNFYNLLIILFFNFLMLLSGYLGEINYISKLNGFVMGFIFFFAMYGTIWKTFMNKNKTKQSEVIYYLFLILWAFYGIFYMSNKMTKIVGYNILDLLAKAFVGIFFWLYLTKCIVF